MEQSALSSWSSLKRETRSSNFVAVGFDENPAHVLPEINAKNEKNKGPRLNAWANALQITSKIQIENRKIATQNQNFVSLHRSYLNFVSGILCARHLVTQHELGGGEDIDRFAIRELQGVITASFSVVRSTHFSKLRICCIINNLRG